MTPPALERVVKVCLAKDPDDRLQTAHDVMQERAAPNRLRRYRREEMLSSAWGSTPVSVECPRCRSASPATGSFCGSCGASLRPGAGESSVGTLSSPSLPGLSAGALFAERYRIVRERGRGGMGVVFEAHDTRLKRTVALKLLPAERTSDPAARARFWREAQAAASLDHPNICTVHEIAEADGQVFIAMAYVEGETLRERLASGPMAVSETVDIALELAEGLREAHAHGVVHRDVKPANVMITPRGTAKILDFGLAKAKGGEDLSGTHAILGTVAYMSPEQARGGAVDHRTDVWSLGCLIYELLAGRRLFDGGSAVATLHAILSDAPVSLAWPGRDVPAPLEALVRACLERDPRHRCPDMNRVIEGLRSLTQTRSVATAPAATTAPPSSIAVLPFVNMSQDPENEYFGDGLSEEIIGALTRVPGLRVVARTSSFAFKGEKADLRDVGRRLGVDTVLEGSVRRVGSRVRVMAQHVKVSDGCHLWSERFDREMLDVFAIQDEITARIVDKLSAELSGTAPPPRQARRVSLEAYEAYLRGRHLRNQLQLEGALSLYEQAVEREPGFARAWAALAEALVLLSAPFDILPSREVMPRAREAADRALRLDPTLADAHVSLGMIATYYDWDREAAAACSRRALELGPGMADAHVCREQSLTYLEGKLDEAKAELEKAEELDPLNINVKIRLGFVDWYRRDHEGAIARFQRIIELEPSVWLAHSGLMCALASVGRMPQGIAAGERALGLGGDRVTHLGVLGHVYAVAGRTRDARRLLADLEERSPTGRVSSFWMAAIHVGLGQVDEAFERLERACDEREGSLIVVAVAPPVDPLRADPRYARLLRRMGLAHLLPSG
jgi:serine/threonine-protein kinase